MSADLNKSDETLLSYCDDKHKKAWLVKRIKDNNDPVPCFAFNIIDGKSTKFIVSIESYNEQADLFVGVDGLLYNKAVYIGFLADSESLAAETEDESVTAPSSIKNDNGGRSLVQFGFGMGGNVSSSVCLKSPNIKAKAVKGMSFLQFKHAYESLELWKRCMFEWNEHLLSQLYETTKDTSFVFLSVEELVTKCKIINLAETSERLNCSVEDVINALVSKVGKENYINAVKDANGWVNCNFVIIYQK